MLYLLLPQCTTSHWEGVWNDFQEKREVGRGEEKRGRERERGSEGQREE